MNNTINVSIDCVPAALREFFAEHSTIALAFSGGTDSSYLLYAAKACGANVHAYYVSTPFQPQFELDDAKLLAESLHADMTVLPFDVLTDKVAERPLLLLQESGIRRNPESRKGGRLYRDHGRNECLR